MNINELEYLIRQGGFGLANHLETHWPAEWDEKTEKGYEMREANISLQVAHAFHDAGMLTYAEIPFSRAAGAANRFDLIATSLKDDSWLVLEAKRAFVSAKMLSKVAGDVERVVKNWRVDMIKNSRCSAGYGAIVATTWTEELASWWTGDVANDDLDRRWNASKRIKDDARWGSFAFSSLYVSKGKPSIKYPRHHFLYAIFPVK